MAATMTPKLSICIPTYNRSKYLGELLDSIIEQNISNIEVIISDDCSPDDTSLLCAVYKQKLPGLKFIQQKKNLGLDLNFLAAIEAAGSEYVWLVGDDDRFEPGGINAVLTALNEWPGIPGMTVGVIDYNSDFTARTGLKRMPPTGKLNGIASVFTTIPSFLGFMSTLIVNRGMWLEACRNEPILDYKNYYIQVFIIGCIIKKHIEWGVLETPCMGYRSSNDQFLPKLGWLERMRVDITAYNQIGLALLSDQPSALYSMKRQIFNSHIHARIRNAKLAPGRTPHILKAFVLLHNYYADVPSFWYVAIPLLLIPKSFLKFIRYIYRIYQPFWTK
jgi:glycosyltransferase involved in cell wall biosynthesis